MKKTVYECDKCHAEAESMMTHIEMDAKEWHLCPACMKRFEDWLDEPIKITAPATQKLKGCKVMDEGKIKALYEGGWSIAKIADEMGASESTISKRLVRMGLER